MNLEIKKKSILELEISQLAFGGKGIAKVNHLVIFIPNCVPGDRLKVQITKCKSNYAEARILEYLERSPDYIAAECRYFGHCGGCKWQDLIYMKQLEYKKEQLADCIERIASMNRALVTDIHPSPQIFAYRNKMEFSFSDRRWLLPHELGKMEISKEFALGFHVPNAFDKILDIDNCHLQDDVFNQILRRIKSLVKDSGLPIYNLKENRGVWRFLMMRKSFHRNEIMINFVTESNQKDLLSQWAPLLVKEFPQIVSIVNNLNRRVAQTAQGEEEILIYGRSFIVEELHGRAFEVSANSFFQTNTEQAERLYSAIRQIISRENSRLIYDLYSGTGTISILLADLAEKIIGFELVESAVENARSNLIKYGIKNCEFICGDVRKSLLKYREKPDVLIVDPPRDGLHADVIAVLVELEAENVIYVSCNPATLARDLKLLDEKYMVDHIQAFDMFPHTYHIEALAFLRRRK